MSKSATTAQATAAAARSGILAPSRPDKMARMAREVAEPRAVRRGRHASRRSATATERRSSTSSARSPTARSTSARTRSRTRGWRTGSSPATRSRSSAAITAASPMRPTPRRRPGLRAVYMNTEFAGPQIDDVCKREGVAALVFDEEYDDRAPDWAERHYRGWTDSGDAGGAQATLEELIAASPSTPVDAGGVRPTVVMLTSGTTGTPKGAPRSEVGSINSLGALFDRVPFRTGEVTYIAPPFFHALGFANLSIALSFGCEDRLPPALRRRGVPARRSRSTARRPRSSCPRCSSARSRSGPSGSPSSTPRRFGSSSAAARSCPASPRPRRSTCSATCSTSSTARPRSPTPRSRCPERPPRGADDRRQADDRHLACACSTTRATRSPRARRAGSSSRTGWSSRATRTARPRRSIAGLMSSGDVGHFDAAGRLFIDGRDDDMIVSGGENVFPQEVEELLLAHPDLADAAVIGVDDEDFGQRLAAYVVAGGDETPGADELKALRALEPRPLQGPARRPLHRRAAAKRNRQGPEAKAPRRVRARCQVPVCGSRPGCRVGPCRPAPRRLRPPRGCSRARSRRRSRRSSRERRCGRRRASPTAG